MAEALPTQVLSGDLVEVRPARLDDAEAFLELRNRNREFFGPLEPVLPATHFTLAGQVSELERAIADAASGRRYALAVTEKGGALVGRVTLSNVARGAWQNATVGYYIDRAVNGRGYATQAVILTVRFAFEELGLHRVQGAVMPRNTASRRVLEKAGFSYEGFSPHYLQINGAWEDHEIFAITVENWT